MPVGEFGALIAVLIAMGIAVRQIRNDPRITWEFTRRTLIVAGIYLLYVACGFGLLLLIIPRARGEYAVLFLLGFFLDWIALGVVWLIRTVPRLREPPRWLMRRWSMLDWTLIAIALGCLMAVVPL